MRWPWSRRRRPENGRAAARAKDESSRRLADAMRRGGEVQQARDRFAALIEQALRGTR